MTTCDPTCVGIKPGALRKPQIRRPPKYFKVQETKKTDWKYEFLLEPSKSCLLICCMCLLLIVPALLATTFTVMQPDDKNIYHITPSYIYTDYKTEVTTTTATTTAVTIQNTTIINATSPSTLSARPKNTAKKAKKVTTPKVILKYGPDFPTINSETTTDETTVMQRTTTSRSVQSQYQVGVGIADMTGPPVQVPFMGNGNIGNGIHMRQYARAFNFISTSANTRVVIVVAEVYAVGHTVRMEVIKLLRKEFGEFVYMLSNVFIIGTSTINVPSGHIVDLLLDMGNGYSNETHAAYVNGIFESIKRSHTTMTPARLYVARTKLDAELLNRSPSAYVVNNEEDRNRYETNVDKFLTQLRIARDDESNHVIGVMNWIPGRSSTLGTNNTLVSSDNFGYAAYLMEKKLNEGSLSGKAKVVTAFAPTNQGDVIFKITEGRNRFLTTKTIGTQIYESAMRALHLIDQELMGDVAAVHMFVDLSGDFITESGDLIKGCTPAFGKDYGIYYETEFRPIERSNNIRNSLKLRFKPVPDAQDNKCHDSKYIDIIFSDKAVVPFNLYPKSTSLSILNIGGLVVIGIPGDVTTMAGRKILRHVNKIVNNMNTMFMPTFVISSLVNEYIYYITTPEEYKIQNYEGKLTIFGPNTLKILLLKYGEMATALFNDSLTDPGIMPEDNRLKAEHMPQLFTNETSPPSWTFGDVLFQPRTAIHRGNLVRAVFVGGNPRNDLRHGDSYVFIEKLSSSGQWVVVATDADWETKFIWTRSFGRLGSSRTTIEWEVPTSAPTGLYRIKYRGTANVKPKKLTYFESVTDNFKML